nr:ABC transporter ATP-binding protein [Streptacidiphilus carbonis]
MLETEGLTVRYRTGRRRSPFTAVHGVGLTVGRGETVALVGESGSGKSSVGNAVLGLTPVDSGRIRFDGEDITRADPRRRRALTAEIQAVFQDPYGSLNPVRTIGQSLVEPLLAHRRTGAGSSGSRGAGSPREQVAAALERVGLPADAADRYPAHFSGGQRQRIAIARALIVRPRLIVCDEPTSALDLSIQAQVINLLNELQRDLGVGYLFITHDLAIIRHVAHRVVVLYGGHIMETGSTEQVCDHPRHPYSRALLAAAPVPDPEEQARRRNSLADRTAAATPGGTALGCPFAPRCPHAAEPCRQTLPPLEHVDGGQLACLRYPEIAEPSAAPDADPDAARRPEGA